MKTPRSKPLFWGALAFTLLVVVPLYAMLVVVATRTRLFDLDSGLTDEQYKAVWAFLGVAVGTAATVMGAILTRSTSNRNQAQQLESESRQKLEAAVQAMSLIKHEGTYAPKAVTAGALATLVHLGHPSIAMRATEVAVRDRAVATETAVWLIDQVLVKDSGDGSSDIDLKGKGEAVALLLSMTPDLTREENPGEFSFPTSAQQGWPTGLLSETHFMLMHTLVALLVSRSRSWWTEGGGDWGWTLYSLDELIQEATVPQNVRVSAATYAVPLLSVYDRVALSGWSDTRAVGEVEERVRALAEPEGSWLPLWDEVAAWCEETATGQPTPTARDVTDA